MCITTEPQFSDHNSYPFNYFCPILAIICPSDLTSYFAEKNKSNFFWVSLWCYYQFY